MHELKQEPSHSSITERWDALEDYFVCITECELTDQNCVTSCLTTHLKINNGSDIQQDAKVNVNHGAANLTLVI